MWVPQAEFQHGMMEQHTHSYQHDLMKWPSDLGQPRLEVEVEGNS